MTCKNTIEDTRFYTGCNETVEVPRETLNVLRTYADAYGYEYGDGETYRAIITAGIALGLDDPTPDHPQQRDANER